jgi:two-component sensor histidine kinase
MFLTPTVLVATLFGRWQAGLVTLVALTFHAWYFHIEPGRSLAFIGEDTPPLLTVNVFSGAIIIGLAELFRRAVRRAVRQRDLLMRELEHRVKNSFTSLAGVLQLQKAGSSDKEVQAALGAALGRIESYAQAYSLLEVSNVGAGRVDLADYLQRLCRTLEEAEADGQEVTIACTADSLIVPRDKASVIGLLINEVVTNALKHAFADGQGSIRVRFSHGKPCDCLIIEDNGRGFQKTKPRQGSLGMGLIDGLARQARGRLTIGPAKGKSGTRVAIEFPNGL